MSSPKKTYPGSSQKSIGYYYYYYWVLYVAQAISAITLADVASTETTNIDTQPTTNAGETTTTKEDTAVIKNTESLKLIRSGKCGKSH